MNKVDIVRDQKRDIIQHGSKKANNGTYYYTLKEVRKMLLPIYSDDTYSESYIGKILREAGFSRQ
ncbi:MAG: hypothetical protein CI947_2151 [Halanaerobium sp.]|nr:MAG: hypothetical protein CI947_2151 [Halanaerobium sp.]